MKNKMLYVSAVALIAGILFCATNAAAQSEINKTKTYPVVIDYSQSFDAMVAAGKYEWKHDQITVNHFPVSGSGKIKIIFQFVHLNRIATSDEILAEIDRRHLRPATLPELLAFGAKYPDFQQEFPVVALGSTWTDLDGRRFVTFLSLLNGMRSLSIRWSGYNWYESCHFLVVSK